MNIPLLRRHLGSDQKEAFSRQNSLSGKRCKIFDVIASALFIPANADHLLSFNFNKISVHVETFRRELFNKSLSDCSSAKLVKFISFRSNFSLREFNKNL